MFKDKVLEAAANRCHGWGAQCWQPQGCPTLPEEPQQILWQTWAVPTLTRGCVWLGTLLCSSGCKLLPEPLPLLDPEAAALGCGFSNVC